MLIPSIDLQGGRTVQLVGGRELALDAGDPLPWAERFARVGDFDYQIDIRSIVVAVLTSERMGRIIYPLQLALIQMNWTSRYPSRFTAGFDDAFKRRQLAPVARRVRVGDILGNVAQPVCLRLHSGRGNTLAVMQTIHGDYLPRPSDDRSMFNEL